VRSLLTNGSDAVKDAKVDKATAMALCDALRNEVRERISIRIALGTIPAWGHPRVPNARVISRADLAAAQYESVHTHGYGHQSELTGAAFHYLRKVLRYPGPVEVGTTHPEMSSAAMRSEVVVIGRDPGSSLVDMNTWGEDVVIVDPWADAVYRLSALPEMQKPERDVKSFLRPQDKHYLSGNLEILHEVGLV